MKRLPSNGFYVLRVLICYFVCSSSFLFPSRCFQFNTSYRKPKNYSSQHFISTDQRSYSNTEAQVIENDPLSKSASLESYFIKGPSLTTKPDYDKIHGPFGSTLDRIFLTIFRKKMAENVGVDSNLPQDNYQGLMELTAAMNARYSDRKIVHKIGQQILRDLFPSWLPFAFSWMFAKPFPEVLFFIIIHKYRNNLFHQGSVDM